MFFKYTTIRDNELRNLIKWFAQDYLAWVRGGAQNGHPAFSRRLGMCYMLDTWAALKGINKGTASSMHSVMTCTWGSKGYPFGGYLRYLDDSREHTTHRNVHRLAWVRWAATMPDPNSWRARIAVWVRTRTFKAPVGK